MKIIIPRKLEPCTQKLYLLIDRLGPFLAILELSMFDDLCNGKLECFLSTFSFLF